MSGKSPAISILSQIFKSVLSQILDDAEYFERNRRVLSVPFMLRNFQKKNKIKIRGVFMQKSKPTTNLITNFIAITNFITPGKAASPKILKSKGG